MRNRNNKASRIVLISILIFYLINLVKEHEWKYANLIQQDTNYYYIYLPAIFIYKDISFNYIDTKLPQEVQDRSWTLSTEDGKHRVSKMPCGYAVMEMPFFLIAHAYERLTKQSANGYTITYRLLLCLSAFFYFVIALIYQRKILLYLFNDLAASFTLVALFLATNLFYYTIYSPGMTHIYSYCLFNIFIWQIMMWKQKPSYNKDIVMGLLLGLIIIVRPTNVIIALFPLAYLFLDKILLKRPITEVKYIKHFLLFLIFAIVGILPQLIIWKMQTGKFIYYSYGTERLLFNHPHIIEGLFSFRNGMFVYAPVLLFIIPGFIFSITKRHTLGISALIYFLVNCYVVFSWWCWWYGGSFGMRAMIESYAVLSIPLTMSFSELFNKFRSSKYIIASIIPGLIILNLFQSVQAQKSLLHWDSMTARAYLKIFGRLTWPRAYSQLIEAPDYDNAKLGLPEREPSMRKFPFLKTISAQSVYIKDHKENVVSADQLLNGTLIANRTIAGEWENFMLITYENEKCMLISYQNKYVSADLDKEGKLIADRADGGDWELFSYIFTGENKFILKAANNKYVKIDSSGQLYANTDQICEAKIFNLYIE